MSRFSAQEHVDILEHALTTYTVSDLFGPKERKEEGYLLHQYGFFGTAHIAAILRVSYRTVARWGYGTTGRGGKFSPTSLSTLVRLAKDHAEGKPMNRALLRVALHDGCSASIVALQTGYSTWETYKLRED